MELGLLGNDVAVGGCRPEYDVASVSEQSVSGIGMVPMPEKPLRAKALYIIIALAALIILALNLMIIARMLAKDLNTHKYLVFMR